MLSRERLLSHVLHVHLKVSQPEAVLVVLLCSCLNGTFLCESRLPGQLRGKEAFRQEQDVFLFLKFQLFVSSRCVSSGEETLETARNPQKSPIMRLLFQRLPLFPRRVILSPQLLSSLTASVSRHAGAQRRSGWAITPLGVEDVLLKGRREATPPPSAAVLRFSFAQDPAEA